MKRSLSVLAALVLASATALAQQPQHAAADSMAAKMNGTWEGPFTSEHLGGGRLQIVVAHDSAGPKVTMQIFSNLDIPVATLTDIKHDGGKITWAQETSGMPCTGAAEMTADGALAGTLDCGHAVLSFTLNKNISPKGK